MLLTEKTISTLSPFVFMDKLMVVKYAFSVFHGTQFFAESISGSVQNELLVTGSTSRNMSVQ